MIGRRGISWYLLIAYQKWLTFIFPSALPFWRGAIPMHFAPANETGSEVCSARGLTGGKRYGSDRGGSGGTAAGVDPSIPKNAHNSRWCVFILELERNNTGKSTYDQTVKQLGKKNLDCVLICTVFFPKEIGKKIMAPTPLQWFHSMDSSTGECLLTPLDGGSLQPPHVWSSAPTKNHVFTWCLERNNIGSTTYDQNAIILFCKSSVFVPFLLSLGKSRTKHYIWCIKTAI